MNFNLDHWFAKNLTEDTLFYYKGSIGSEKVTEILDRIEIIINDKKNYFNERKKILNIFIELIQNLYHHGLKFRDNDDLKSYGCIIFNHKKKGIEIISANFVTNEKLNDFTHYIDYLNAIEVEELKLLYQSTLSDKFFSKKGGGGLGIIKMIIKSENKLDYYSQPAKDGNFFLVLTVKV